MYWTLQSACVCVCVTMSSNINPRVLHMFNDQWLSYKQPYPLFFKMKGEGGRSGSRGELTEAAYSFSTPRPETITQKLY